MDRLRLQEKRGEEGKASSPSGLWRFLGGDLVVCVCCVFEFLVCIVYDRS